MIRKISGKPGNDPAEPNNHRPIALTSCICNVKLKVDVVLESNNHISRFQSGFRSERNPTDNLVRLETFICDAFINM